MAENKKFNRQKNDYLLTDLLPYEKGNHYTHRHFYEYLQKKEKGTLKKLFRKIKDRGYFNSQWHSSPLKFNISKKGDGFREISLINPLGLLESLAFIHLFESDVLNIIHNKKDFSSRKASRTNSLTYKKDKNQTIYYSEGSVTKNQLLIALESSGTYFKHYPFKTITQLLNSKRFIYSRDKFDYLLTIDIQDCFPSIYTHSYKWLITNKTYDSKNLKGVNSVYSNIDTFLQNINGSKTNGIIVGPEISRLLADFLFIHIDQQVIEILAEKNLVFRTDYNIFRFVDDYFICSKSENVQNIIKEVISNILNTYQLKINEFKVTRLGKEDILDNWKLEVLSVIEMIEKIFNKKVENLNDNMTSVFAKLALKEEFTEALLEAAAAIESTVRKTNYRKIKYIDLRSRIISVIKLSNEKALVCSYILSTILRKIEVEKDEELSINMELNELIIFIFFVYSTNINYSSTQKVIRIFSLLFDKYQVEIKEIVERNIERFEEDIFTKFSNDWIDLLLFFANYQINIPFRLIEKITDIFIKQENPVNLAALCIFAESEFVHSPNIVKNVNRLVKHKIEKINWEKFFQDEHGWWVYIFLSYPKLNKKFKKDLTNYLRGIKSQLESRIESDESKSDFAKIIVLNFLLDNDKHFIEWNFTKDNYYKNYYFYTKDRTVFNPDIIDQISISR
ncbi:DNA-binding protein [Bacillus thuringiensis]|uniref:RNA-directed DNA polymerase n=2 Tax=Bacillus thuringiensis TaxID=1428 RepID=UPI000BF2892B|nr:RNA-directed DNA polymerase [Bacillus thuringiensis]PES58642.1 DNA-binding protein [Bacillus thuringiensis]PFS65344.1 DNA-binding protein [Bacillus thuringiensis]PGL56956.1 DNA-binding protein [Bacillus thuringiensis]